MCKVGKAMEFRAGQYVERADGAVYVAINDNYIFFADNVLVAILTADRTFYQWQLSKEDGVFARRQRQARGQWKHVKTKSVSRSELNSIVEAIVFNAASKLVDKKLVKGD